MEKHELESLIVDYIDGKLVDSEKQLVEDELAQNAEARKLYEELKEVISVMEHSAELEPSPRLREGFDRMLGTEVNSLSRPRTVFLAPALYRVAAAVALLVIGGGIGFWISKHNAAADRLAAVEKEMEVTRKQLADTKQMMMTMLGNDLSASQRIKGVHVALGLQSADDEIVRALLNTMLSDPSTNVRLAALDALGKFRDEPMVRRGLVDALSVQKDPMVQIALIQMMVEMKEKSVLNDLRMLIDDAGTMKAVKDEAYSGILKLS